MVSSSILQLCSMLALASAAAALSAEEFKTEVDAERAAAAVADTPAAVTVDVYSGPKDCPDESKVQPGSQISLHFTGSIDKSSATGTPGKKFESTRDGDSEQPLGLTIGIGKVIKGLDEGILGLCEGSKANLVIPPYFGYGPKGVKDMVPGGATVHYDVEVVSIHHNFFKTLDTDRDGKLTKSEVEAFFETIDQVMPDEMWEQEDRNGDGMISWEEFSGPKGNVMVGVYSGPTDCPDDSKVQKGSHISLHYTGSIDESSATGTRGKKFDSSRVRSKPVDITIGIGKVIRGWDEGIVGLCVGSKANLVIPPDFGYGDAGVDANLPGGATLHFDIEVVSINESPPTDVEGNNLFVVMDEDGNGSLTKSEVEAYFEMIGQVMPDKLWAMEDKNGDGVISWEEFSGPK